MSIVLFALACLAIGGVAVFLSGLLGIGGGIIIIPALAALLGARGVSSDITMHLALGTSLAAVPFNAMVAALSHNKHIKIDWDLVKVMAPGMIIGSLIGPSISVYLSGEVLRWIFGIFLGGLGLRYIFGSVPIAHAHKTYSKVLLWVFTPFVGIFSSMLGLGGGVFVVPLLTRAGVAMKQALAVSAVCLVPASLIGVASYIYQGWGLESLPAFSTGYVYWPVVASLMLMGFICAPLGVRLAHRLPHEKLRRYFGILLVLVALEMCYTAWGM